VSLGLGEHQLFQAQAKLRNLSFVGALSGFPCLDFPLVSPFQPFAASRLARFGNPYKSGLPSAGKTNETRFSPQTTSAAIVNS
jgi:hypothetical protein